MASSNNKPYLIRRPDQIAAIASPVRQEVLDGVQAIGPCAIFDLATFLGRAPDSLYYHIRMLEKVGLLIPCGQCKAGRRDAAMIDVPGRPIAIDQVVGRKKCKAKLIKAITSLLRLTERDMKAAFDSEHSNDKKTRIVLRAGRVKGWLTKRQFEEANQHILALEALLANSNNRKSSQLIAFTYALTPIEPHARSDHDIHE